MRTHRCLLALLFAPVGWCLAFGHGFEPAPEERRAAEAISEQPLRAHIRFLADDLLEGRGPGTRGDLLTQRYIATQFEALGLGPAAPDGTWYQPVPLVGVTAQVPKTIRFRKGPETIDLAYGEQFVATSGAAREQVEIRDAEIVFVGYGMEAPEYQWDDYKEAELRGKVLLVMNNDPSSDPELFAGPTRLYYGRWDYKYAMAARKGAVGAIIIHTTESAGYPWQVVQSSWSGEQFQLRDQGGPRLRMEGWVTDEAARQIVQLGGADLELLRREAEKRTFRPVPLGVRLSLGLTCEVRLQQSANVLGMIQGSDPERRKELVVYTAHHDHLGIAQEGPPGADRIYNGALDNASGVAALLTLAQAYMRLPSAPPRSVLFAAVGAEEQGLLGSRHLAAHPPIPPGYLAACINIDGVNIWGRTRDVTAIGLGKSSLDAFVRDVATWQGRTVKPDQFPDRGYYYRSDQFSFAKIGVPGVYLHSGTDLIGRPPGSGRAEIERWVATHYHQPSDEYSDDWDLSGAVENVRLLFYVGLRAAQDPAMPTWTPGDEFEAARKAALQSRS